MPMTNDSSCVFCKIASGVVQADIIYQDSHAVAFLDIRPVAHGHTLVIPREHHASMMETPAAVLSRVVLFAQRLMGPLQKAMAADYIAVSVVGTDVPHFHVHLIPRRHGDGLADFWPQSSYQLGESAAVAQKIVNHL